MENTNEEKFLRTKEVKALLGGISTTTLWRMVQDGRIPKPIKLNVGGANLYKKSWIDKMLGLDDGGTISPSA